MSTTETARLVAQLRTLLTLTNTEIQIATARQAQARIDAVRDEDGSCDDTRDEHHRCAA